MMMMMKGIQLATARGVHGGGCWQGHIQKYGLGGVKGWGLVPSPPLSSPPFPDPSLPLPPSRPLP